MQPERANTPRGDRTHDLRIWNPLLYQLSYRRDYGCEASSLPLDLVECVSPQPGTELLKTFLHLLGDAAFDADLRAVIEVSSLRALKPDILTIEAFLSHCSHPFGSANDLGHDA